MELPAQDTWNPGAVLTGVLARTQPRMREFLILAQQLPSSLYRSAIQKRERLCWHNWAEWEFI
jgi:hypothetical protein